jgi:hypothetical protein
MNILLVSNKMLHDLRCTSDNPATYENILYRQSQVMENDGVENYNCPKSVQRFSNRMSITNDDGTMIDIRKEKSIRGKEEYVETKYDKEGNIVSRKRADNLFLDNPNQNNNFHELNEYNDYDEDDYDTNYDNSNNTYYQMNKEIEVRNAPSIIYETAEAQEYVYTAPAKYDPHVTINKPIEETIINGNLSENLVNNIIRNTMNVNNYTNNDYNIQNGINGYNYTQNVENYDIDNYNNITDDNQFNYNEQYNLDSNKDIYTSNDYINNGSSNIIESGDGTSNVDFTSYDYKY